jgi:quercetin dioxygenase-like cupin family protein
VAAGLSPASLIADGDAGMVAMQEGVLQPRLRSRVIALAAMAASLLLTFIYLIGSNTAPSSHSHGAATHAQADAVQPAAQAARPTTVVTPVSCQKLPNVPGKSMTTVLVDFPPGAYTPRHRHPGSVMAFVLKGTVHSQLEGGVVGSFGAGQTWFEPPGIVHLFAENASATEPAQILAVFVADDDCGPLTIPD